MWQRGLSYILLKEALATNGCPICTLSVSGMKKYFYWLLYENINAVHLRKQLIEAGGYCNNHAWMLYNLERQEWSDNLGTAILYQDLVKKAVLKIEELQQNKNESHQKSIRRNMFDKKKEHKKEYQESSCPACIHQKRFEDIYISSLIRSLVYPEFQELYKTSYGLCMEHLYKTLNSTEDEMIQSFLLDIQHEKMQRLSELLAEYIRKHDYRFINEPKGEETISPNLAVEMMVGKPLSYY